MHWLNENYEMHDSWTMLESGSWQINTALERSILSSWSTFMALQNTETAARFMFLLHVISMNKALVNNQEEN